MGYASALKSLLSLKKHGYKFGLKRMRALCRLLGNPQEKYRVVHVAGTNGKGSTTVFCANMLQCAGFKVGCFTSPFLDYFEEQIKVNGKAITKPELAQCIYKVLPLAKKLKCSFFEAHTACALLYFASRKIDAAVVEVGLGGRLDATNVVKADVAVITQIGLEHTDLLGDTLGKIAREKAGIIKNGSLVITGVKNAQALAQIKKACRKNGARLIYSYKDAKVVPTSLAATHTDAAVRACGRRVWCTVPSPGKFQLPNIACAVLAFVGIKGFFDGKAIAAGLEKTAMRGRLETVGTGPLVVMDCAHNPQAFVALSQTLGIFKKNRIVLVFGAMKDKDSHGMLKIIRKKIKHVVLTSPYVRGRALNARQLVPLVKKLGIGFDVVDRPQSAVSRAKKIAGRDGMVLVAGSMYMLSQARHWKISRNHY